MVDRGIVQEWIEKAEEDFEFARINLEEGKRFFAQICFHLVNLPPTPCVF